MKNHRFFKLLFLSTIILLILGGCSNRQVGAVVTVGDKEGMIVEDGSIIIKPKFDKIYRFDEDLDKYSHKNHVNLHWIHNDGDESYAIVKNFDNKFGIIDKYGKQLIKIEYDSIGYFKNGFAKIELNKKFGLINKDFKIVLKPKYDDIEEFTHETAVVKYKDKYGCIDKDMNLKIKPEFDRIYLEYEGMRRLEYKRKWGFANDECDIVAKPNFDFANNFFNGYAKVKLGDKFGYIDKNGEYISKEIFDSAEIFR